MHGTYTLDTFEGTTFWSGGGHGIPYELWLFNLVPRLSGSHSQLSIAISTEKQGRGPGTLGLGTRLVVSRQQRVQVVTNKVRM